MKKILYEQLPPNVTSPPDHKTNKETNFTKDYLSNQYSIEPNRPTTDLNFFCQMWFVPWRRLKKETVLDKIYSK